MKLLRVTQIEKFRRYIEEHSLYDTEQSVIDSITGAFKGNSYTYIGTAFHRIIEGDYRDVTKVENGRCFIVDGNKVMFDIAQYKIGCNHAKELVNPFHEIREYQQFGEVIVTGQADVIEGFNIRDTKTKFSPVSDKDYTDSIQWKLYLELFASETFLYDIFVFDGYDKDKHGTDVRGLKLHYHNPPITCHRYNGMRSDIDNLIKEFVMWLKYRGIYDNLPEYDL